jgi:DNA-directed RNA polymerase subunit E'/Rpb7
MLIHIKQKVSIHSKYLDQNIRIHLLNKLKETFIGKCTLEYGYIIGINKIIKLGENSIAPANSLVIFDLIYEADVLKPEIGQVLSGKVCMIFQHGIFVEIQDKMKVLIPVTSISSYRFEETRYVNDNDDEISLGNELLIVIVMIKYEKKAFNCIGKIQS